MLQNSVLILLKANKQIYKKMTKWNYKYDFPAQRELSIEDKKIIAEKTGYGYAHVHACCVKGSRKMPEKMRLVADKILELRQQMKQIELQDA